MFDEQAALLGRPVNFPLHEGQEQAVKGATKRSSGKLKQKSSKYDDDVENEEEVESMDEWDSDEAHDNDSSEDDDSEDDDDDDDDDDETFTDQDEDYEDEKAEEAIVEEAAVVDAPPAAAAVPSPGSVVDLAMSSDDEDEDEEEKMKSFILDAVNATITSHKIKKDLSAKMTDAATKAISKIGASTDSFVFFDEDDWNNLATLIQESNIFSCFAKGIVTHMKRLSK